MKSQPTFPTLKSFSPLNRRRQNGCYFLKTYRERIKLLIAIKQGEKIKQLSALINHSCSFHWGVFWRVITRATQGAGSSRQGRHWLAGTGEGAAAAPSPYSGRQGCKGALAKGLWPRSSASLLANSRLPSSPHHSQMDTPTLPSGTPLIKSSLLLLSVYYVSGMQDTDTSTPKHR